MAAEITPIATFGEDAAMEAEEDCWLVLGDVVEGIMDRRAPAPRAPESPGRGNVLAFPGRADPEYVRRRAIEIEQFEDSFRRGRKWSRDNRPTRK